MTQLYWQGLQTIQQDASIDNQLQSYPLSFQDMFHAQQDIGWDQLYYGCISITWACQVTTSSNYTVNGDIFYATATGLVWKYILDCWQLCNSALHNPNKIQPEAQVLADQVHHILEMVQANPEIAHLALPQPAETILQQPIHTLRHWVQHGHTHVNNFLTAAHQRAVLNTPDIRSFFHPKQANDLRPP